MTITEARKFAAKWQKKFRLQNWRIHVRWRTKADDMDYNIESDTEGFIDWFTEQGIATMILKKDATEYSVCHECIHLLSSGHLPVPTTYDPIYERAINVLVDVLMQKPELSDGDLAKI